MQKRSSDGYFRSSLRREGMKLSNSAGKAFLWNIKVDLLLTVEPTLMAVELVWARGVEHELALENMWLKCSASGTSFGGCPVSHLRWGFDESLRACYSILWVREISCVLNTKYGCGRVDIQCWGPRRLTYMPSQRGLRPKQEWHPSCRGAQLMFPTYAPSRVDESRWVQMPDRQMVCSPAWGR